MLTALSRCSQTEVCATRNRQCFRSLDTSIFDRIIHPRETQGPIAQLVEQLTLNQRVAGSSPARLTILVSC